MNSASVSSYLFIVDIALKKQARQSSTLYGASAARAVDGNSNPNWGKGSCTHTHKNKNAWWEVNFGKIYNVTGVEITNRGDCCGDKLKDFNVSVDGVL